MSDNHYAHHSVMLQEAMTALNLQPGGVYIDGTYGRGGHADAIMQYLGSSGRLLAIDKDPEAIADAQRRFAGDQRFSAWRGSFRHFSTALQENNLDVPLNGFLLDLGVSSPQLDDAQRGFSFMRDGALDMRMDPDNGESAAQWLNQASEEVLSAVLWRYGEERAARRIAKAIVQQRQVSPILTTQQLASLIEKVIPRTKHNIGKHPATRSFQALRIQVNKELEDIEECLKHIFKYLAPGGRLVVISFHSLEDRIVKQFLRNISSMPVLPKGLPLIDADIQQRPTVRLIGKAQRASLQEVSGNSRARSAIMRIAEKI